MAARGPAHAARRRVLVLGAAGRDLHNLLTVLKDDASVVVVAFLAVAQIPTRHRRQALPR
jgi:predicted GTPase